MSICPPPLRADQLTEEQFCRRYETRSNNQHTHRQAMEDWADLRVMDTYERRTSPLREWKKTILGAVIHRYNTEPRT